MAITPARAAILRPISSFGIFERFFIALANISTAIEIPTIAVAVDPNPFNPPLSPENALRNRPSSVINAPMATTDFITFSFSIEDITISDAANIPIAMAIFKSALASKLVFQDDKASRTPSNTPTIVPFISPSNSRGFLNSVKALPMYIPMDATERLLISFGIFSPKLLKTFDIALPTAAAPFPIEENTEIILGPALENIPVNRSQTLDIFWQMLAKRSPASLLSYKDVSIFPKEPASSIIFKLSPAAPVITIFMAVQTPFRASLPTLRTENKPSNAETKSSRCF